MAAATKMNPLPDATTDERPHPDWPVLLASIADDPSALEDVACAVELLADRRSLTPRALERRIAHYSRRAARAVIARRKSGDLEGAAAIESAAMAVVELARRGAA